jgi:hypothetical protein
MRIKVLALTSIFLAGGSVERRALAGDPAAAQVLFDEGKALMAAGRAPEACGKFAASDRLDHGIGTQFHLAECYARTGKTALAWTTYLAVAADARAHGEMARAAAAHDRAAALEGKLPRMTIDPGVERSTAGLEITRDGVPVAPAEWGVAVPVDPGAHAIEARATGKAGWRTKVDSIPGATIEIVVPVLADAPSALAAPAAAPAPVAIPSSSPLPPSSREVTTTAAEVPRGEIETRGTGQRVAGIAIGIVGLAGLGIGGYYGLTSLRDHDDAQTHCTTAGCDATGVSLRNDARRDGDVATVALAVGGGLVAVGAIVLATAPRSHASIGVAVGPGSVVLGGKF